MIASLILTLSLSPPVALPARAPTAPAPVPTPAQDPEPSPEDFPDKREEVKELIDTLKDHVGKRGDEDEEAIAVIDRILGEYSQSGVKDRAAMCKALSKVFEARRKDLESGLPDNGLYMAAGTALGLMGPESAAVLTKWIGHKKHRKDLTLQRVLVLSLGKTRDDKSVRVLVGLLQDKDAIIVGAAAEALGQYAAKPLKVRKDAFESMLKVLMSAKGAVDSDLNDTVARERYDVIAAPLITSMQALSGHDERKPDGWQRWWNKNKKKDWDAED
ncbi:MAG: HEAT repeat domain-containing protein [Planctomycetota bacterium]|jgi:hypothetical protein|nr:HEAT repeat domain-containing protein [Planctomycetota bacterium]MDP6764323.1 HEAT repeat domain-containing protein [Planctomycetota bacterium]MDP6988479.1 HEAT repeat domain-containing protein [Planctomycetota bacterium]